MNNAIFVIKPYKWNGMWVFDDERVGLDKEPFMTPGTLATWPSDL
jgi:hypothetical protein